MSSVALAAARAPLLVALDAGSSSVRALAFDCEGQAIQDAEEQLPYSLETTPDGGATYAADRLFDLAVRCLDGVVSRLGSRASEVAVVGSTSFWHSLMGIDDAGTPTTPVLYWADTRSAADAAAMREALDAEAIWQRTGCRLHSSYWPAKLRWLQRTDPETFRRTKRWLSFPEYALGRLCGAEAGAATVCMASGTGLLDVHITQWDAEMLAVAGIDQELLSPLVDLGPPGGLGDEYTHRWPALTTARWFPALGDGACANVGSGAIGPSRIALTVGTSAAMRLIRPLPPGEAWAIPSGLWAYRLDRSRAVVGGALSNGGNLLRWVWEMTGTRPDSETTREALHLPPDSTGLTFLPFLAGERSPGWYDNATGVVAGLTLATTPAHLLRAAMEAVAYRLADVYESLAPLAAADHQVVVSGGGILELQGWLQITADTLGHSLIALGRGDESTARGAALMAAVAAGVLPSLEEAPDPASHGTVYLPQPENYEHYQAGRERQTRLEQTLVASGGFE
jgi:gluconokinase